MQASKRYAKANNIKTPGYDAGKPDSWIVYQDCEHIFSKFINFFILINF